MGKLGELFRTHGPEYRRRFAERMSLDQLRAMHAIETCHTPAAGSALWRCTRCGHGHFTYQGCGNRHCPSCGRTAAAEWLQKQSALLLPGVTYHLVTFTVPEGLRRPIRSHPRELLDQLMRTSSSTLLDLCENTKWVGGVPGVTAVLHTWTRQGEYHPHVHFIVTGGALDEKGLWRNSHPRFLVPVPALSKVFCARLHDEIKEKHPELFALIKPSVWNWRKKKWVVHSEPVGSGEHAYRYLARYVYQVFLSESAIGQHDASGITVRYRKSGSRRLRTMRLEPMEFLRRFLQHVLPSRFCKVRHYGLHHSSKRKTIKRLQAAMAIALGRELPEPIPCDKPEPITCSKCEADMVFEKRFTRLQRLAFASAAPRGPPS
ncbi:MAG: transposase [Lentisphaeria bacterium]|nr:transposase [Lentisphaeria bacterium]